MQDQNNPIIKVKCLRFVIPMDGAGLSVNSSCSTNDRYDIEFHPRMRHFKVMFKSNVGPLITWIHETQVKSWDPPAEVARPAETKRSGVDVARQFT